MPSRSYRLSVSESPLVKGRSPDKRITVVIQQCLHMGWVLRQFTVLTFALSVSIQDFSMSDPLHVAVQVFIQLLTLSQLLELST